MNDLLSGRVRPVLAVLTLLLLCRIPELRSGMSAIPLQWLRQRPPRWQFVAAWLLVPVSVFMLARSRLPLYVLPLFAPLALVIARLVPEDYSRYRLRAAAWISVIGLLLLGLKFYASTVVYEKDARTLAEEIRAQNPWSP